MESKKISVILPVYNGARFVGKSIESVLSQTYKNIELIIVNDCSTDDTLEVILEYAKLDSRIKILNNDVNKKLPETLNVGFREAQGDYWTWTSDDNCYHATALERMAAILDGMPDIELVYTGYSIVDKYGTLICEIKERDPQEIRFRNNIGACFLYRSSLAKKVGEYDSKAFLAEDYEFFIRCYQVSNGRFYHIEDDLYDYTRHEESLSSKCHGRIAHKAFEVMDMHFDFLLSECYTQSDRNRFFSGMLALLDDEEEIERQRKRFYELDPAFAYEDKNRLRKRRMQVAIAFPYRILRKVKGIISKNG